MTDQQGPDAGHLGLEAISDLDEGLLSPAEAEAAREHLAGCAQCQDDLAALTAVREALAGEREIAMPDDVAAKVFGALAELPPLTAEDRVPEPVRAAVTTLPARRAPRRATKPVLIALSAAAGVALIALGIVNLPRSTSSTASSAAGTSAAPASVLVAISHSGRDYTATGLGAQALALLPGGTSSAAGTTSAAAAAATSAAPAAAASSGPTFATSGGAAATSAASTASSAAASSAPSAASAPLPLTPSAAHPAGQGDKATTSAAPAPTTDVLAPLEQGDAGQRCLMTYEPKSGTPLAIDIGTFQGKPALIGVFQDPTNSARLQVVAVGPPDCSLYSFALIAKP